MQEQKKLKQKAQWHLEYGDLDTAQEQGFKNSPTLFDEALHQDLAFYRASNLQVTLLQYVDDLLIAAPTQEVCQAATEALLTELTRLGYRASAKKAQICQPQVTYLGYSLREGKRWLTEARKQTVTQIPVPTTPRQVREFLGTAGFCRLWIPGYATLAAPLYPLTKKAAPFVWGPEQQQAFDEIKKALLSAPALALPDVTKPFVLFVDERSGVARGVLTQQWGPWKRPVAYLSKKLDPVSSGWPACLRVVAAVALLVKDSDKLTLGQKLTVVAPHALESVIRQPPERWMSNARMTHYQTLLLNRDRVEFAPPAILNPATLLPDLEKEVLHTCQEILAEETGTRQDLQDQPLGGTRLLTWYTDGSSYIMDGKRMAGAAVVDDDRVVWASGLPTGTSAQRAELIALTQALKMAEVFLDTFSGWTEAFPTKTETAQTVSKKILEEIFPRFGIPKVIGSDNGPAFVAQVTSLGGCAERGVGLHQGSLSARRPLGASPVPGGRPSLREKAPDRKPRATVEGTFHHPPDYSHSCKSGRRLFLDTRFTSKEGTPGPGLASNSD
ncbi:uncharacterized protein [Manis javanica]|uniref:uncharacterized protein n=1 Tax=Manis javanica TaxID=9974 RepID=UPI003C6CDA52